MDVHPQLGYLVFSVRRPARWQALLGGTLGLPHAPASGAHAWRLDDAAHRLIACEGRDDDLQAIGLDCGSPAALARLLARLAALGVPVQAADEALRAARRVQQLHRVRDPAGNTVELFTGLAPAGAAFESAVLPGGFCTGALGIGHAALVARDLPAMERFYVDALGFGVSERLKARSGPLRIEGTFLHCNARHHSIALFDLPLKRRLHHFMLQANRLADVGRAWERVLAHKVPQSLGLGQHPDPDGTFSFYAATPAGFDFEIGWGGQEIEPAGWQPLQAAQPSAWGHRPSARLKLKMATAVMGQWIGAR